MNKTKLAAIYKNLICASIGLLLLFFISIFVIKAVFQEHIDTLIDQTTLLKEYLYFKISYKYPTWGQFPGTVDGQYTHTLTLYNISTDVTTIWLRVHSLLLNQSLLTIPIPTKIWLSDRATKGHYNTWMNGTEIGQRMMTQSNRQKSTQLIWQWKRYSTMSTTQLKPESLSWDSISFGML